MVNTYEYRKMTVNNNETRKMTDRVERVRMNYNCNIQSFIVLKNKTSDAGDDNRIG
jgi:hypothetical protein